jgi:hypothetical protein
LPAVSRTSTSTPARARPTAPAGRPPGRRAGPTATSSRPTPA